MVLTFLLALDQLFDAPASNDADAVKEHHGFHLLIPSLFFASPGIPVIDTQIWGCERAPQGHAHTPKSGLLHGGGM